MSSVKTLQLVKFASKGQDSFYDTIKKRVNEYFETNNISKHSGRKMHIKTVVMIAMYFVPYALIATGLAAVHPVVFYALWIVMGFGISGIGMSVMHDSNHGAYSENDRLNSFLGNLLNLIGGYARNWKIQHNILHHTYTNLDGLDEDIDAGILLRMSPHAKRLGIHRYQHIYAWPLYCLMNLFWVTWKDYKAIIKYDKNGLLGKQKVSFRQAIAELTGLKLFYFGYMIVVPILFSGMAWYHVVLGFVFMHMIAGFVLACVFQLAHVMEESEYPLPAEGQKMENSWAIHQLLNTVDFAPRSTVLSWFVGGLNFQIEHHLFPQVCHIHYPVIAKIVKQAAQEYGLPYHVQPNFAVALVQHGQMLKKLGQPAA